MADVIDMHQYIKDNNIVTKSEIRATMEYCKSAKFLEEVDKTNGRKGVRFSELGGKIMVEFLTDMYNFITSEYPEMHKFASQQERDIHFTYFCKDVLQMYSHPAVMLVNMMCTKVMDPNGKFDPQVYKANLERELGKKGH